MTGDHAELIPIEVLERERREANMRTYQIEHSNSTQTGNRRQPRAGCYPLNFSPFKMTASLNSSVGLNHLEIKRDKNRVLQLLREEFKSVYFDEVVSPQMGMKDFSATDDELENEDSSIKEMKSAGSKSALNKSPSGLRWPLVFRNQHSDREPLVPMENDARKALPENLSRHSICVIAKPKKDVSHRNRKSQRIYCWKPRMEKRA
ncbi:hypothetical protein GUITHDRAFT_147018 [Guillardia theta CCMP2712]|uniref:Uncharacterized protein n=1 Tax=Guillardia theta (strain CCMP2712) TaxID=905079 RepID=L1IFL0_GUITC|nr:hypothetical protein GUITHDRAFT_147018 [Guillardia theta CCMP2712]EKX34699.1 hypothetical protein GUITHDRAFT_147018 [Guillardia theta CCMP2712]|eukprot:XP_005821679.1 hypothetical protein GUITHDRAFT_147018 [Guillardia theta CCMP2712]